jgi:hypothetical protein
MWKWKKGRKEKRKKERKKERKKKESLKGKEEEGKEKQNQRDSFLSYLLISLFFISSLSFSVLFTSISQMIRFHYHIFSSTIRFQERRILDRMKG